MEFHAILHRTWGYQLWYYETSPRKLKFACKLTNSGHFRLKFWTLSDWNWERNNKRRVSFKRRGQKELEIINADALMRGNTVHCLNKGHAEARRGLYIFCCTKHFSFRVSPSRSVPTHKILVKLHSNSKNFSFNNWNMGLFYFVSFHPNFMQRMFYSMPVLHNGRM